MKRKFCVGILLCILVMCVVYNTGYEWMNDFVGETTEYENRPAGEVSGGGPGKMQEEGKFYLREEQGYLNVYRTADDVIYQYTKIILSSLPENLRKEVNEKKYLKDYKELYNFLENYST